MVKTRACSATFGEKMQQSMRARALMDTAFIFILVSVLLSRDGAWLKKDGVGAPHVVKDFAVLGEPQHDVVQEKYIEKGVENATSLEITKKPDLKEPKAISLIGSHGAALDENANVKVKVDLEQEPWSETTQPTTTSP